MLAELANRWTSAVSGLGICSVGGAMRWELLSFMFDESREHDRVIAEYRRSRRSCCSSAMVTVANAWSPTHAISTQASITHGSHQHCTPQLRIISISTLDTVHFEISDTVTM